MSLIRIEKRGTIDAVDDDNFIEHLNTNFEEALPRSILDDENYVYWIAIPVNEIPDLHRAGHSDAWDTLLCNQLIWQLKFSATRVLFTNTKTLLV